MLNDYRQMKQYQQDRFDRFSYEAHQEEQASEASPTAPRNTVRRAGWLSRLFKPRHKLTIRPER